MRIVPLCLNAVLGMAEEATARVADPTVGNTSVICVVATKG